MEKVKTKAMERTFDDSVKVYSRSIRVILFIAAVIMVVITGRGIGTGQSELWPMLMFLMLMNLLVLFAVAVLFIRLLRNREQLQHRTIEQTLKSTEQFIGDTFAGLEERLERLDRNVTRKNRYQDSVSLLLAKEFLCQGEKEYEEIRNCMSQTVDSLPVPEDLKLQLAGMGIRRVSHLATFDRKDARRNGTLTDQQITLLNASLRKLNQKVSVGILSDSGVRSLMKLK